MTGLPIHEVAALAAALCWAITGLMSATPVAQLGPFGFNLIRQSMVTVMLGAFVLATGSWVGTDWSGVGPLILSGLVGILAGDTMLFFALRRLGPRRTGAMFALNAPIAALAGWAFLDERLSTAAVIGVAACAVGVAMAVLGRPGRSGSHRFEAMQGPVWQGVAFGLLAAAGQAAGSLIARPVMAAGFDPALGSLIRVAIAVVGLALLMGVFHRLPVARIQGRPTAALLMQIAASGFIAMAVGMTLLLFALQGGKVGIVSTLSALSPVLILPVLWAITGARPSGTSWGGALIAAAGMALIFLR
ncbi:DMT family transporter [Paracoccus sp. p4-l81]|uniref:DMT family transporter n=1 Tax=unclassified Paracoccus (in: a-proteobacteria) TaxID=2688777 RepID=UPI0035B9CAEB